MEACAGNASSYDAIVVDEGQDFAPDWIESLKCLVANSEDAPFFVFADTHQELWNRNWRASPVAELIFELRLNLRNSLPIAEKVAQVVESDRPLRGAVGVAPQWRVAPDSDVEAETISILEALIDQGLGARDITVLCQSATLAGRLRERIVGPYSLGKWGSRGIVTETISRFKGLESAAIVLVLEDGRELDNRCLAYVGISRARAILVVVGSEDQKTFVRWG